MVEAALGTTVYVPALDGDIELKLPAGTQPGEVKVYRNRGVPVLQGYGRGDLKVVVNVQVPRHLTDEQRERPRAVRGADRRDELRAGPELPRQGPRRLRGVSGERLRSRRTRSGLAGEAGTRRPRGPRPARRRCSRPAGKKTRTGARIRFWLPAAAGAEPGRDGLERLRGARDADLGGPGGRLAGRLAPVPPPGRRRAPCACARRGTRRTPGLLDVVIDTGMAFGTGSHFTTRLCLRALQEVPRGVARRRRHGVGRAGPRGAAPRLRARLGDRQRPARRSSRARATPPPTGSSRTSSSAT